MIKIENLNKSFGDNHVLKDISLTVNDQETLAIIGPSGGGKSTLLRCLDLLEVPESGKVTIDEYSYDAKHLSKDKFLEIRRATAMVFQNYNLFANKKVIDNIALPLIVTQKKSKEEAYQIAEELLERVDLSERKDYYPHELSGGQQQRVGIARALALHPHVILFDEPTSALDPELVQGVLDVIKDVAKENITTIIVTHEMAFARDVADRAVFMDEGHIVEEGKAYDLITNPQKDRTKQFLSRFLNA